MNFTLPRLPHGGADVFPPSSIDVRPNPRKDLGPMNLHAFSVWLRSDWTHLGAFIAGLLFAYSTTWGAFKAAYFKVTGHALPRNGWTLALDIGVELSNNGLGFLNKLLLANGSAPLFPAPSPPLVSPPSPAAPGDPSRSSPGRATVAQLVAVVAIAGMLGLACPHLPPVSGCSPTTQRCNADRPEICSASQRWEPSGDLACAAVGGVCSVNAAGVAHCAPGADGGVR